MYFASIACNHTGQWLGACFVNAPDEAAACEKAAAFAPEKYSCVELAMCEVPPGPPGIPPGYYGRLLTLRDLKAMGPLTHFTTNAEGKIERRPS